LPLVGKASRKKNSAESVRVSTVKNPDQSRSWFLPVMVAITLLGAIAVGALAMSRESNTGVRPEALTDHWHAAYGIYVCDSFQAPILDQTDPEGIHTHADGVIHIHPFRGTAAGNNATVDAFFRATGGEVNDEGYFPGPAVGAEAVIESEGCNGEPATWQLAYWDNAILAEGGAEPDTVIIEDIANFKFRGDIAAMTLALVPEGVEIPAPPTIPSLSNLTDI
jgi:hypothetical protein